jgi:hypothetical protein
MLSFNFQSSIELHEKLFFKILNLMTEIFTDN